MSNRVEYPDSRGHQAPSCCLSRRPISEPGESLGRGHRAPICYPSLRPRMSWPDEGLGRGHRAFGRLGEPARELSFTLTEMPFSGFWVCR